MLTNLYDWAHKHRVPVQAMSELRMLMDVNPFTPQLVTKGDPEAAAQQQIRLEAPCRGMQLWRNNVGAVHTEDGRFLRFGLANDTKAVNEKIKSSDLIGITPRVVTPQDIGKTFGIFTSIEVKRPGWTFKNTAREKAQLAWIKLILKLGGFATFARGPGDIWK